MNLSVVIPTFNRGALLVQGLQALAGQCEAGETEVIVVDDGSDDGSLGLVQRWALEAPMPVTLLRQPHRGPAAARNRGLAASRGRIVLFLGDDVRASPGLVEAHVRHHEAFPAEEVAVLGRVTWAPDMRVTPLMRWLEHGGPQFCYDRITDPMHVPPDFFWTANVSAKRRFVVDAGGFDERFPGAAFEDVELGVRLAGRGLTLHFEPRALGYHYHPMTLGASLARMENLARGALIASASMPQLISLGRDDPWRRLLRRIAHSKASLAAVRALAPWAELLPPLRAPYYRFVHDLHYRAALGRLLGEGSCSPS